MRPLITSVTGLRFIRVSSPKGSQFIDTLFAGIGNQVHVLQPGKEEALAMWAVLPDGERVHGFSDVSHNWIAVHGGRYVALVHAELSQGRIVGGPALRVPEEFDDWVWGCHWLAEGAFLAISGGHSKVWLCSAKDLSQRCLVRSTEKELTWSTAFFVSGDGTQLHAVAGTSFGDLVFWTVSHSTSAEDIRQQVLLSERIQTPRKVHRLRGHDGPVMKLKISHDSHMMVSGSVDRTVRVWETVRDFSGTACCPDFSFVQKFVHYGHLARVWDVAFLQAGRADVVSVAEDRTCRIWSGDKGSCETAAYRGHTGRNVWSVAVQANDENRARIATGGEDGCVKIRTIANSDTGLDGNSQSNRVTESSAACGPTNCISGSFEIPGKYPNPRKNGGSYNESGRTLLLLSADVLLMSTDFGRILLATFHVSSSQHKTIPNDCITWTELHRDPKGVAYTPSSLTFCNDLMFAGQTNGNVTILQTAALSPCPHQVTHKTNIPIFFDRPEMVMGLFSSSSTTSSTTHLFAATQTGDLYHWLIHSTPPQAPKPQYIRTYRQTNPTKSAVVTSVLYIPHLNVVLVGDRGGRVLVYDPAPHNDNIDDANAHHRAAAYARPLCTCRPHGDRVSTLILSPHGVDKQWGDNSAVVMTGGFDGGMSRVRVTVSDVGEGRKASVRMVSMGKSGERMDTIGQMVFPRGRGGEGGGVLFERGCVVGFKAADVVIWDVREGNEVLRWNCGNWRRAYDVYLEMRCGGGGGGGRLVVEEMTVVFWRSGRLHVVRGAGGEKEGGYVESIGEGFHGQRGNAVWGGWEDGVFVTAGEDGGLGVWRIVDKGWRVVERLRRHVSGVSCVGGGVLGDGRRVMMSGGGGGEVIGWVGEGAGMWKDVCGVVIGEGGVLQRVMCIVVGWGGVDEEGKGEMGGIAGRSDGSLAVIRMVERGGGEYGRAGGDWKGEIVAVVRGGGGAVLCCDKVEAEVGGEGGTVLVTGDSRGGMEMWWMGGGGGGELRRMCGWEGVHDGGVNGVGVCEIGEVEGGLLAVIVSGGDDERVKVRWVKVWGEGEGEAGGGLVRAEAVGKEWASKTGMHCAAVTGVAVQREGRGGGAVAVSVGADQRVRWVDIGEVGAVGRRAEGRSNVWDIGGVCLLSGGADRSVRGAVVCGCGMEMVWGM